jgi:hypothetical protein
MHGNLKMEKKILGSKWLNINKGISYKKLKGHKKIA